MSRLLAVGTKVRILRKKIVRPGPEALPKNNKGVVVRLLTSSVTGETPEDPLYEVQFADGRWDGFWREELARRTK